jgi:hypothetical protein
LPKGYDWQTNVIIRTEILEVMNIASSKRLDFADDFLKV